MTNKEENLSWEELTRPLRDAINKSGLKEEDVVELVYRARKK